MSSEYDVYLNGVGYHLLKRADGQLQSGAAQERKINPFAKYLQSDRQYQVAPFRVSDGCGIANYDGSHRYQHGDYVDTRSGEAIVAAFTNKVRGDHAQLIFPTTQFPPYDEQIGTGGYIGIAQRFIPGTTLTAIRALSVMVRRDENTVYDSASDFTVKIYDDASGKPGTQLSGATKTIKLKYDEEFFLPFADRWKDGQFFWLECIFSADVTLTPGNTYWIAIENNQSAPVYWAEKRISTSAMRSVYSGGAWQTATADYPLCYWLDAASEGTDTMIRCMRLFAGIDKIRRLYVGTGYKVMAVNQGGTWTMTESKELAGPIVQMLEFNEKLFVAQGWDNPMWYSDGTSATGNWTELTGKNANALAIHDNMLWRASGKALQGSADGTTWDAPTAFIGDPGAPIQSMVSHGGKLFCAKPEGIFEVTYPSDYPGGTAAPVGNLMLDFRTELAPRASLIDWHSGLYFPGLGGIYELKGGILRNIWTEKIDEGAQEVPQQTLGRYTRRRCWSPIYDAEPGSFTGIWATSRGLYALYSSKAPNVTRLYCFDGRNWHDLGPPYTMDSISTPYYYLGNTCFSGILQDNGGGRGWLILGSPLGLLYWRWPTWTNDRAQDSWADYVTDAGLSPSCSVVFPSFSTEQRGEELVFMKVGVTGARKNTDNKIQIQYKIDNAASWTTLGEVGVPVTGGYDELIFPAGTTGRTIQLKAVLGVGVGITVSPRVSQVDLLYQTAPESYTTHQLMIHAAPDLPLHDGAVDTRTTNEILTALRALADSASFTYLDPAGGSHTARVTGMSVQHMRQTKEPGATLPTEAVAIVTLLDV